MLISQYYPSIQESITFFFYITKSSLKFKIFIPWIYTKQNLRGKNKIFFVASVTKTIFTCFLVHLVSSLMNFKVPQRHARSHAPFFISICTTNDLPNEPMRRLICLMRQFELLFCISVRYCCSSSVI